MTEERRARLLDQFVVEDDRDPNRELRSLLRLEEALAIAGVELSEESRSLALDAVISDTRVRNVLTRAGVASLAILLEHSAVSLRIIRGIGEASCRKITADLRAAIATTGAPAKSLRTYLAWKQERLRELEQRLAAESYRRRELERGRP